MTNSEGHVKVLYRPTMLARHNIILKLVGYAHIIIGEKLSWYQGNLKALDQESKSINQAGDI